MKYKVIIPARGGSKRLPKKNTRKLDGIPLFVHSINYANNFSLFQKNDIYVNTDDDEIEKIASKINCKIFRRSKDLGSDLASTSEVIKEQVEKMINDGEKFDAVILLQPTNPLRLDTMLINAIELFEDSKRNSLSTFSRLNKKIGIIKKNHFYPENYSFGQRSQDQKQHYYENGLIYITKVKEILKGNIISKDVFPYVIDHEFAQVDIDEANDFLLAEFLINK
jgi:CMP-N-acetylneuraminic acid synthetase